jgi:cytochrome c biogenesis factor
MAIHPPSLYTGYVSASVPFAFGTAALISGPHLQPLQSVDRLARGGFVAYNRWGQIEVVSLTPGDPSADQPRCRL